MAAAFTDCSFSDYSDFSFSGSASSSDSSLSSFCTFALFFFLILLNFFFSLPSLDSKDSTRSLSSSTFSWRVYITLDCAAPELDGFAVEVGVGYGFALGFGFSPFSSAEALSAARFSLFFFLSSSLTAALYIPMVLDVYLSRSLSRSAFSKVLASFTVAQCIILLHLALPRYMFLSSFS